ncbi:MAG: tetratricopeptide repeat protein [Gammaproteobacteria bacterium]
MMGHLRRSLLIVLAAATVATAADTPEPARAPGDVELADARTRIKAKDWTGARDLMQKAVARDPKNAEYHNLLAYAIRHTANPNMDVVFKHYNEALRLDPKHRGAHEYIGEAYLLVGNLTKAKEHLAALDKLCFFSCEEHRDLKKAIQEYEVRKK